eukprot:8229265-Pyramimonas_sp.AAC.1
MTPISLASTKTAQEVRRNVSRFDHALGTREARGARPPRIPMTCPGPHGPQRKSKGLLRTARPTRRWPWHGSLT